MITDSVDVDVAVIGGSVGGCTAATLFARAGLQVAVLEQSADPHAFKKACTHYIQPCARATITRLGIEPSLRATGAISNRLEVWTQWGWIRSTDDAQTGFNIRRQSLDPILRAMRRIPQAYVSWAGTPCAI